MICTLQQAYQAYGSKNQALEDMHYYGCQQFTGKVKQLVQQEKLTNCEAKKLITDCLFRAEVKSYLFHGDSVEVYIRAKNRAEEIVSKWSNTNNQSQNESSGRIDQFARDLVEIAHLNKLLDGLAKAFQGIGQSLFGSTEEIVKARAETKELKNQSRSSNSSRILIQQMLQINVQNDNRTINNSSGTSLESTIQNIANATKEAFVDTVESIGDTFKSIGKGITEAFGAKNSKEVVKQMRDRLQRDSDYDPLADTAEHINACYIDGKTTIQLVKEQLESSPIYSQLAQTIGEQNMSKLYPEDDLFNPDVYVRDASEKIEQAKNSNSVSASIEYRPILAKALAKTFRKFASDARKTAEKLVSTTKLIADSMGISPTQQKDDPNRTDFHKLANHFDSLADSLGKIANDQNEASRNLNPDKHESVESALTSQTQNAEQSKISKMITVTQQQIINQSSGIPLNILLTQILKSPQAKYNPSILYGAPLEYPVSIAGVEFPEFHPRNIFYTIKLKPVMLKYDPTKPITNAWTIDKEQAWKIYVKFIKRALQDLKDGLSEAGFSKVEILLPFKDENEPTSIELAIQNPKINLTVSNTYGKSFLEQSLDFASGTMMQLAFMTQSQNLSQLAQAVQTGIQTTAQAIQSVAQSMGTNVGETAAGGIGGTLGGLLAQGAAGLFGLGVEAIGGVATGLMNAIEKARQNASNQQARQALDVMTQILSGARIDLPDVWQDVQVSWSISLQVVLASSTSNIEAFVNRILIPLILLAPLAFPRARQSYFYTWPLQVEVELPSGFKFPLAGITSFSFDFDKKLVSERILNVNIGITPLYHTMFLEAPESNPSDIPEGMITFNRYIRTLLSDAKKYLSKPKDNLNS